MLLVEGESCSKAQRQEGAGNAAGQDCGQTRESWGPGGLRDGLGETLGLPQQT